MWASVALALAWAPTVASAGEAFAAGKLIEVLAASDVVGDGATRATVHLLALDADGDPIPSLKLKAEVSAGTVGDVIDLGGGLYQVSVLPPKVATATSLTVSFKGRSSEFGAIEVRRELAVVPGGSAGPSITVAANPTGLTLGTDAGATMSLQLPAWATGLTADDLVLRASAGTVTDVFDLGGGRWSARYVAPASNVPQLALITVADRRQPDVVWGHGVVPLAGKVEYPVTAAAGAGVLMRLGGREFGPVKADASGVAKVPIVVPPGVSSATVVTLAGGQSTETVIDLGVPPSRRVHLFPAVGAVPGEEGLSVPVRALVLTPEGSPDTAATLTWTATAGRVGTATHLGGGVYEAPFVPPSSAHATPVTVQAALDGAGQSDGVEVLLAPQRAGLVTVASDPVEVPAAGGPVKLYVRVENGAAAGLPARTLRVDALGAASVGEATDLGGGDYRVQAEANPGQRFLVQVGAPPLAQDGAVGALANILVVPLAERAPADGVTLLPVQIATLDAWGLAVPGQVVELSVAGAGRLPVTVTTDAQGLAWIMMTPSDAGGLASITARSGGRQGAANVVVGGAASYELPASGTASDVILATAWSKMFQSLEVPVAGGVTVAPTPVVTPEPAVEAAAATASEEATTPAEPAAEPAPLAVTGAITGLTASNDPVVVPAGGSTVVQIRAVNAEGAPVRGGQLELLASGGARFDAVVDRGDGTYEATMTVPADLTVPVKVNVLDAAGVASARLEVMVGPPVAATKAESAKPEKVAASKPEKEPRAPKSKPAGSDTEFPALRLRASALISSYAFEQAPGADSGPLLSETLKFGGSSGGAAKPLGLEVAVRAFVPQAEPLGFYGSFRFSRYKVDSSAFSEPARDSLLGAQVGVIGRAPIDVGTARIGIGARAGFRYDDFITFRGCTDPGCKLEYRPLGVPALDAGLDLSLEVSRLFVNVAAHGGFAYGAQPYAINVDAEVGVHVIDQLYIDVGFGWQRRTAEVSGKDSGITYGTLTDQQLLGTVGVGVAF